MCLVLEDLRFVTEKFIKHRFLLTRRVRYHDKFCKQKYSLKAISLWEIFVDFVTFSLKPFTISYFLNVFHEKLKFSQSNIALTRIRIKSRFYEDSALVLGPHIPAGAFSSPLTPPSRAFSKGVVSKKYKIQYFLFKTLKFLVDFVFKICKIYNIR